jgi:hypothetical protein
MKLGLGVIAEDYNGGSFAAEESSKSFYLRGKTTLKLTGESPIIM